MNVIGRQEAKATLDHAMLSAKPELVVITGRRRIGKTFLVREYLKSKITFQFTGLYNASLEDNLKRFTEKLIAEKKLKSKTTTPKSWFEAFDLLRTIVVKSTGKQKQVIFIDEFPWLATNKSKFLMAFTDFWNSFGAANPNLMVVICGSAASWMINKVLKNKGGLHNRVTERIHLQQFSLKEAKALLTSKGIKLGDMDMLKLYMCIGGVPYYLDLFRKGESFIQFIDRACFAAGAPLRLEYQEIFSSLFSQSGRHIAAVEVLHKSPKGLNRQMIAKRAKINSGGGLTTILDELEASGFVHSFVPYGNIKKEKLYKLKDHYLQFYLSFIAAHNSRKQKVWEKIAQLPAYRSWAGLAFENICHEHIDAIRKGLAIEGIYSEVSSWWGRGTDEMSGAQVDLLIDRADNIINICEVKFSSTPFTITADYSKKMRLKAAAFQHFSKTKKALHFTLIAANGVVKNKYSKDLLDNYFDADVLFT